MSNSITQFPHCDPRILHAPGECKYCDAHPDWQELRAMWNINFTNGTDPDKFMCPANVARGFAAPNKWHSNHALPRKCKNCGHPKAAHRENPQLNCLFAAGSHWEPEEEEK